MQQRVLCAITAAAVSFGITACVTPRPQVASPAASTITVRCDTTARAACGDTTALARLQRTLADTGQIASLDRLLESNQMQLAALERVLADSSVFVSLRRMLEDSLGLQRLSADTVTLRRMLADSVTQGLFQQLERRRAGMDSLRRGLDSLLERLPRARPDSGSR